MRFVIYTQDHEPPHVHVLGNGELKVALSDQDGLPQIMSAIGMKTPDRRKAMDVVLERQSEFMAQWRAIHGSGEGDEQ